MTTDAPLRDALVELVEAVEAKLGTMNFYFGTGARTAVSSDSVHAYKRIKDAVQRGKAALDDTPKPSLVDARIAEALRLLAECLGDYEPWSELDLVERMEAVYEALGGDLGELG